MSSAPLRDLTRSLSFRLALWHAGLLLLALGLCYVVSYLLVASFAQARADAFLRTEADECAKFFALQQEAGVREEALHEAQTEGAKDVLLRLTDPAGKVLFETDATAWAKLKLAPDALGAALRTGTRQMFTASRGGHEPEVRLIIVPLSDSLVLLMAASMHNDVQFVHDAMRLVLAVMIAAWIAAVLVGFFVARRGLARVHAVRDAAIDFSEGRTTRRVLPSRRGDEVDRLATAFNGMAERIEALLGNLRQTNDSLAHELRSPVTGIRGRCELALTHGATAAEAQGVLADTIERCDHLLTIINTILELSETDAGVARLTRSTVDLAALLTQACEMYGPVADDAGVTLAYAPAATVVVPGDTAKLQRLFANLLDNAVKYTGRGGRVTVGVTAGPTAALVTIQDTGPGIGADELEKVFQRFYRGAASDGKPGNGLGLCLARTLARAHGGDICAASAPGRGALFTVRIPLAAASTAVG